MISPLVRGHLEQSINNVEFDKFQKKSFGVKSILKEIETN